MNTDTNNFAPVVPKGSVHPVADAAKPRNLPTGADSFSDGRLEKSGLSRLAHNQESGGSNPSPAPTLRASGVCCTELARQLRTRFNSASRPPSISPSASWRSRPENSHCGASAHTLFCLVKAPIAMRCDKGTPFPLPTPCLHTKSQSRRVEPDEIYGAFTLPKATRHQKQSDPDQSSAAGVNPQLPCRSRTTEQRTYPEQLPHHTLCLSGLPVGMALTRKG